MEGRELFVREDGGGETLLLLHGFPTASWDWHRLWTWLTRRFRVVAVDLLGFGFSDKPHGHRYSLFEQADLVESVLAALDGDGCHLLAHDYGDTVAQELLARDLERGRGEDGRAPGDGAPVRSACLLNGGVFPEAIDPLPVQRVLASPFGRAVAPLLPYRVFRRAFRRILGPGAGPGEEELRAIWRMITRDGGKRAVGALSRYQHERREHRARWTAALRETTRPIRYVCGPADPVSGAAMAARWRAVVPEADVAMLGDSVGHYPQLEDPRGVLDAVRDFHDSHRRP